jgi:hypothetical protein
MSLGSEQGAAWDLVDHNDPRRPYYYAGPTHQAPLVAYSYEAHEGLVIQMYGRMLADGDLALIHSGPRWTLTDFLHYFARECALVFLDDKDGIWFAAWMLQTRPSIVELSVWVRKDKRFAKAMLLAMETVCARALRLYSTVIGISRIELLSIHRRLGYRHVGTIADGVELFALTQATFTPRLYREA